MWRYSRLISILIQGACTVPVPLGTPHVRACGPVGSTRSKSPVLEARDPFGLFSFLIIPFGCAEQSSILRRQTMDRGQIWVWWWVSHERGCSGPMVAGSGTCTTKQTIAMPCSILEVLGFCHQCLGEASQADGKLPFWKEEIHDLGKRWEEIRWYYQ